MLDQGWIHREMWIQIIPGICELESNESQCACLFIKELSGET
jgi:hypothetical protein